MSRRALAWLAGLLLAATACTSGSGDENGDTGGTGEETARVEPAGTVRILASSELEDTQPLLERAAEETGVTAEITWSGTLDATRQVVSGQAEADYDAIWLATNDYLRLHTEAADRIVSETSVMTSPVAIGVRPEVMDRLGWQAEDVTWSQVHEAASAGELTFGMTDPNSSNSGYSALISVASALSGAQSALTEEDVRASADTLREFFTGQRLTSGSSGWLADSFAGRQDVDALINYESVLLSLDREGVADLTVVRPVDGVVTARYPISPLSSASAEAREALRLLTGYLRGAQAQQALTEDTLRRPVIAEVAAAEAIPEGQRRELPYPGTLAVADGLLDAYDNELRRPSRTVYVLDTSGSMEGDRLAALKDALRGLTGAEDTGGPGFREREVVTLMPFHTEIAATTTYTVEPGDPQPALDGIRADTDALVAGGGTAVYRSLAAAYELLAEEGERDAFTSIVLMTDGQNEDMAYTATEFESAYTGFSQEQRTIPVFTVLFGDGDRAELEHIAALTGGRLFDATEGPLTDAFQEIRGYQ